MTNPNHFKIKEEGFTLIEIVISLSISVLIFILLTQVYLLAQNTYKETDARAEITQNGRVILDRMIREIRQTPDIITQIPETATEPIPSEIMFQDGHDTSQIKYIKYSLDEHNNIIRQVIIYYFPSEPNYYVHVYDTDAPLPHNPPEYLIIDNKIIGEHVSDIEFYGGQLLNINLYLSKNGQTSIISTSVYGRNL